MKTSLKELTAQIYGIFLSLKKLHFFGIAQDPRSLCYRIEREKNKAQSYTEKDYLKKIQ